MNENDRAMIERMFLNKYKSYIGKTFESNTTGTLMNYPEPIVFENDLPLAQFLGAECPNEIITQGALLGASRL